MLSQSCFSVYHFPPQRHVGGKVDKINSSLTFCKHAHTHVLAEALTPHTVAFVNHDCSYNDWLYIVFANRQHAWKKPGIPFVWDACLDVDAPWGDVMKSTSGPIWFWQWPVLPFHEMGMDQVCFLPGNSIRSVPFLQRRFRCLWNEVVMHCMCLLFAIMAPHLWPTSRSSIFCLFDK